jgi:hypothetical protein
MTVASIPKSSATHFQISPIGVSWGPLELKDHVLEWLKQCE